MDGRVVEEGAAIANGVEELARGGIVHRAEHRLALLHQRRRYGPLRHVAEKGVGPVDRIDHPHEAVLEPVGVVLGFLRQPAVIRPAAEKRALEKIVDGEIGLAHLGAVVLPLHLEVLPEIAVRELACVLDRGLEQAEVLLKGVRRSGTSG